MTENDYSIKPLPNLPNVAGLNPPKGGEDHKKRQSSQKRSGRSMHSVEEEMTVLNEDDVSANIQDDEGRRHIDYRA